MIEPKKLSLGKATTEQDPGVELDVHKRAFMLDHPDGSVMARHLEPKVRDFVNRYVGQSTTPTVTPTVPSILKIASNYNQIEMMWDRQDNLINFSRYEVQVSDDDATWYSLKFDGTDWKSTLNAVTTVYVENLTHSSIPFAAGPLGKKLYYHVRRVSLQGVASAWSTSGNATTDPTVVVDIAACVTKVQDQVGYVDATSGGTMTPLAPTITQIKGLYRAIQLFWTRQLNLTNFDHYGIQVSEDNANWYALRFDGVDWKGAAGTDTQVNSEFLVHTGIVPGGTIAAPTGKLLYYKVRCVTKAPAYSAYSSASSSTTLVVDTGDLAANAITANKILAGEITAVKMAANTLTADQISLSANIPGTSMGMSGAVHVNDDPLPAGVELFGFDMPSCKTTKGRVPQTGRTTVFEPIKIGDCINPRLKRWSKNYIDHGRCDDANNAPHVATDPTPAHTNGTFVYAISPDGSAAYKAIITTGGSSAYFRLDDESGIASGLAAGDVVTFSAKIYIPTTGGLSSADEVILQALDYVASWEGTTGSPVGKDGWNTVTVTRTLRPSISSTIFRIVTAASASSSEYFYVKDIQVEKSASATTFEAAEDAYRGATGVWKATTNYVEHGACTDASNAPHVTGETPATYGGATLTYDNSRLAIDGFACYRMTHSAGGSYGYINLDSTTTMDSAVAGETWTLSLEALIISGSIAVGEFSIVFSEYYSAAWHDTFVPATTLDVWHRIQATLTLNAGTTDIRLYLFTQNTSSTGEFVRIRNVQWEKSAYATPFTPTTRAAGSLPYAILWGDTCAIEFWMRPYFNYDSSVAYFPIFRNYTGSGDVIQFLYDTSIDKFVFYLGNGAGSIYKTVTDTSARNAASLNTWQHIKLVYTNSTGVLAYYLNGVAQTTGSAGVWSARTIPSELRLGHENTGTYFGDSIITDLAIWNTADTSKTHYELDRPYYDETSLPTANFGARLSATGLELYNGSIDIVDSYNREILISNVEGMKAKDAAGNVIHDLPNVLIQTGFLYSGHSILKDAGASEFVNRSDSYTDTQTTRTTTSALVNTSLAGLLGGNTNIRSVIVTSYINMVMEAAKRAVGAYFVGAIRFSTVYNTTPSGANYILRGYREVETTSASILAALNVWGNDCEVPIFWVSGVPYITWQTDFTWGAMANANSDYYATGYIYLKGIKT